MRGFSLRLGLIALLASLLAGTTPARAEVGMACSLRLMGLGASTAVPRGIAVVSSTDAWSVGYIFSGGNEHGFIEHWDGTTWSLVQRLPDLGSSLDAIAAIASNDVWAVGTAPGRTFLAEHWDGTSWTEVDVPGPAGVMEGISALTLDDIWAVGEGGLRAHWDGTVWKVIPGPNKEAALLSVSMASSSDVWDVGFTPVGEYVHPVSDHWDGTRWSAFSVPYPGSDGQVSAVVSPGGDVWALGGYDAPSLLYHWDGTAWTISRTFPDATILGAMAARSSTDMWAVGGFSYPTAPAVFHYDGAGWSQVSTPPSLGGALNAVALDPISGEAWSVGTDGVRVYAIRIRCR